MQAVTFIVIGPKSTHHSRLHSFRPIYFGESVESIKQRHLSYYHSSVLLLESVQLFGDGGREARQYPGLLPGLPRTTGLCTPLRYTKVLSIASFNVLLIFVGGRWYHVRLVSMTTIETLQNFNLFNHALFHFRTMLEGEKLRGCWQIDYHQATFVTKHDFHI